jgi:hypothetical protein
MLTESTRLTIPYLRDDSKKGKAMQRSALRSGPARR